MVLVLGLYVLQNGKKTYSNQNLLPAVFPHNRYKDNTAMDYQNFHYENMMHHMKMKSVSRDSSHQNYK